MTTVIVVLTETVWLLPYGVKIQIISLRAFPEPARHAVRVPAAT
jgi:hypothetical protein